MSNYVLELKNIGKKYLQGKSEIEILKDFNLNIKQSQSVAITGESGSGKSSILSIAGLLDDKYSGEVIVNNISTREASEYQKNVLKNNSIGFVFQKYHLLSNLSARENVAIPRFIRGSNYKEALRDADKLLIEMGLGDKIFNFPGELSGGEQQRVAIARALINKPCLIIADEPTGNLDPENGNIIFNILLDQIKKYNASLLMATHNYDMASRADIVINIQKTKQIFL
jgi:lipoprotein-releasing system ATP-binding protein